MRVRTENAHAAELHRPGPDHAAMHNQDGGAGSQSAPPSADGVNSADGNLWTRAKGFRSSSAESQVTTEDIADQKEPIHMSRIKPVTPEEAITIVEKRRRDAREYYSRMRDDARRHREAQLELFPKAPVEGDQPE
jgi:hypothetical protein